MAEHLLGKTISYISNHTETPFFLYYAPNAHEPRVPSASFKGKSAAGLYGDVIEELDFCVGEIIKTLKEKNIYENTIIVVSSDNAPMIKEGYKDGALENLNGHNPYGKLRGEKYSLHEGGHKVPFIFSWPEKINKPFVQEQPFNYLDLLATFAGMLGIPVTEAEKKDSRNAALLFSQPQAPLYREHIVTQNNGGDISIRKGKWKYLPRTKNRGAELYDLETDPSELHNLVLAYPEIVRQLQAEIKKNYKL